MEDLNKQQIVLLTLLVSFVTSLATGIITVSLMDQAPQGFTNTVSRVVERTVQVVSQPTATSTVTATVVDTTPTLAQIVEKVGTAVIRIREKSTGEITGLGFFLNSDGFFVTDKSVFKLPNSDGSIHQFEAVLSNGAVLPVQIVQAEVLGDIAYGVALSDKKVSAVTWASDKTSIKIGDSAYALSDKTLENGIIKKVGTGATDPFTTTITSTSLLAGTPLFLSSGEVIGLKTKANLEDPSFYPIVVLRTTAPKISR